MDQQQYKRKGGLSGPFIRPSRAPQDNRQSSDLLDLLNSDLIRIRLNLSEFGRLEVQHCPSSPVVTGCSSCPVKLSSTKSRRILTGKGDRMRADGTGPMDLAKLPGADRPSSYHALSSIEPRSSPFKLKFVSPMNTDSFHAAHASNPPSSSAPMNFNPSFTFSFLSNASTPSRMSNHSDDSDSEDTTSKSRRPSGACAHCKSLKVKCEFLLGQQTCRRCTTGNHDCVVRGRKKRKPAPTHEDLQKRFHKQDLQIQSLLHDLDKMKFEEKIRQWSERSEFSKHITSAPYDGPELSPAPYRYSQDDVQVVNILRARSRAKNEERAAQYWRKGIPGLAPPDIITYAVVAPEEIVVLFKIFFDRINPFFSLLDPDLHTPARLIWASPFLFTVICAVASRFYTAKPNLYGMAMEFAREAAGKALVDGVKSIDVCQAYVLLGVYPMPAKKWAKDRSWLFMGVGIRMALELGLHHHPSAALPERERLNRTRTWLNLFCVDGAHATMFGKQPMSSLNDVVSRSSFNWYKASALTLPYDIHLCGYVDILYIMTRFRDTVGHDPTEKAGQDLDITATCLHYEEELAKKMAFWSQRYAEDRNNSDPLCNYRGNTTRLITAYLRLVVLSLGFPFAVKKGVMRESPIVQKCIDVAFLVIHIIVRDLYPTGILRFAMESNFLYVAFAAAFLLNLLRPKLVPLLDLATHRRIITVVRDLIRVLGSKEVVWDGRHTPALYSKFLSALLDKYDHPQVQIDTDGSLEFIPHFRQDRQQTPPNIYSWPDTPSTNVLIHDEAIERPIGTIYQTSGDADMDFSLQYFMQTTQAQSLNSTAPDSQIPTLAASSLMEPDGWGGFNHTQWAPGGFYPTYNR